MKTEVAAQRSVVGSTTDYFEARPVGLAFGLGIVIISYMAQQEQKPPEVDIRKTEELRKAEEFVTAHLPVKPCEAWACL